MRVRYVTYADWERDIRNRFGWSAEYVHALVRWAVLHERETMAQSWPAMAVAFDTAGQPGYKNGSESND